MATTERRIRQSCRLRLVTHTFLSLARCWLSDRLPSVPQHRLEIVSDPTEPCVSPKETTETCRLGYCRRPREFPSTTRSALPDPGSRSCRCSGPRADTQGEVLSAFARLRGGPPKFERRLVGPARRVHKNAPYVDRLSSWSMLDRHASPPACDTATGRAPAAAVSASRYGY